MVPNQQPSPGNKPDGEIRRWLIRIILGGLALLFLAAVAQAMGIPAKIGLNLGIVSFELSPDKSVTPPASVANNPPSQTNSVNPASINSIPASSGCPYDPMGYNLPLPNTWYGPSNGYFIQYSSLGGFYVSDSYSNTIPFPETGGRGSWPRNVWVPLQTTQYSVCVDQNGYVYAKVNY
jgi:hypothetical protein